LVAWLDLDHSGIGLAAFNFHAHLGIGSKSPSRIANMKKKSRARGTARRPVKLGDTAVLGSSRSIEESVENDAIQAAEYSREIAVRDMLGMMAPDRNHQLADALQAIMAGASPDDAIALKRALQTSEAEQALAGPNPDEELADDWRQGGYPYRNLMLRKSYEKAKYGLQVELLKLQNWTKEHKQKVIILFEGRDAAGKGGAIKRFMEHLNPRGARVIALEKPSDAERGQWYFQRYVQQLPTAGEIVLFDRSWYNRAGVERVMGFCTDEEYREFMRQAPEFERNLTRSGLHLIKFWFSVSREEQRRRFKERQVHPLKHWKLSPIDLASLDKWEEYTRAKESMFQHTDTADAPWTVIKSDCKKRARLNAMRYLLHRLPYDGKDPEKIGPLDPLLVGRAHLVYERGENAAAVL
jgi:polyphosphate kinase 2